ncbi:MAG: hypothetical protein H0X41_02485 [Chitinophagaceae bacterium]|nr:hypothetical protein [Chitinophagaceae bacterium]
MSTFTYAALTNKRENAAPGTSTSQGNPGVQTYIDAFAALVPAEVLTLHALFITQTTTAKDGTTTIDLSYFVTLQWSFAGLILLSMLLYVWPRLTGGSWDRLDFVRMLIPPLAFVGWTMLQRVTVFDSLCTGLSDGTRTIIALFLGVGLGLVASALAYQADQKPTRTMIFPQSTR